MPILSSTLVTAAQGAAECYTCPANSIATVNINVCNVSGGDTSASISVTGGEVPTAKHRLEHLLPLPSEGGTVERTALALGAGQKLFVQTSSGDVAVTVFGYEERA